MITERRCAWCQSSMEGKRSHAVYCSRSCKTKASDRRRIDDGRARKRDHERYETERLARTEHARSQYWGNRDAYIERSRRWRADNPDGRKLQNQRRRAWKSSAEARKITTRDWQRLISRFGGCAYCGSTEKIVMDHVIPLSRGGRHAIGNVLPACQHCNASKGALTLAEWRARTSKGGDPHPHPLKGNQNVA